MHHYLIAFFLLSLGSCSTYQLPVESDNFQYRINRSIEESHPIQDLIAPYKDSLDQQMSKIIGYAKESMSKMQPECKLGNWAADAVQKQASQLTRVPIDATIQNYGGLRITELAGGAINLGKIYEIMPFENRLIVIEIKGNTLQLFFDVMALDGGWPVSKEISYQISEGKALDLTIHGQAVDPSRTYHIGLPDYIANGNGGCEFLADLNRVDIGVLIRELLIKEVIEQHEKGLPIESEITGRIRMQ